MLKLFPAPGIDTAVQVMPPLKSLSISITAASSFQALSVLSDDMNRPALAVLTVRHCARTQRVDRPHCGFAARGVNHW
jgi:hypothetical protein